MNAAFLSAFSSPILTEGNTDEKAKQKNVSERDKVPSTEKSEGPSPHIITDRWTLDDALGYRAYAHAIARFITHPKTGRPLCISIQAPWGQGKTSLMRMIQEELDSDAVKEFPRETTSAQLQRKLDQHEVKLVVVIKKPENLWKEPIQKEFKSLKIDGNAQNQVKPCLTIWFNSWAYENTEQVWSGLADSIVQQIAARLKDPESTRFLLRLHIRRYGVDAIVRRIYDRISTYSQKKSRPWQWGSLVGFGASSIIAIIQNLQSGGQFPTVGIAGIAASIGVGVSMTFLQRYTAESNVKNEPVRDTLGEYIDVPDYRNKSVFMSHVVEDIQSVIQSIPEKYKPMVIFIDDLDRCSPTKVVGVIEAINLFLGGGYFSDCVFVIGMDAEMVAAALKSYSKVISKLQDTSTRSGIGWKFMDKFVQLPFSIPPAEKTDINNYVDMLLLGEQFKDTKRSKVKEIVQQIASKVPADVNDALQIQQITNMAAEVEGVKGDPEKKLINYKVKEGVEMKNLNKMIDAYSEEDPKIREQILDAAPEFWSNPRDVKRFMNVFRFQYFILLARHTKGLRTPRIDQLTRWTILSLKWPDFVRWLQVNNDETEYVLPSGRPTTHVGYRLAQLEYLGKTCGTQNEWQRKLKSELKIKFDNFPWITDEVLRNFFKIEGNKEQEEDRLSASAGLGVY